MMTRRARRSDVSRRAKEVEDILARADALDDEGFEQESADLLRDAVRRFPDEPEILLKAAIFVYDSAPDEARGLLRATARLAEHDPNMLTRCAASLVSQRAFDDAEEVIKAAAALAPDGDFELEWALINTTGRLAGQLGNYEPAEEYLLAAFEAEPETPQFGEDLARLYEYLDRSDEAVEVLDEALRHNPEDEYLARARREVIESSERGSH